MSVKIDKEQCCGCLACVEVCPFSAISSGEDENGFLMPVINETKCVQCGKCEQICAFRNNAQAECNVKAAFSFRHNDTDTLLSSTSGGAFTALSDCVLEHGGSVAGAVLDERFILSHQLANTKQERDSMRFSKYIQSNTADIFDKVKAELDAGKNVMFVGTPCQSAQLNRIVGDRESLLTCDFLCHGVPSQSMFSAHIKYIENKHKKKAVGYSFRGKRYGWNHGIDEVVFSDGTRNDGYGIQCYTKLFQNNASLRDSCFNCPYRGETRYSDLTIADFWDVEKVLNHSDVRGVSLILVNSEKGRAFADQIASSGSMTEVPVDSIRYKLSAKPIKGFGSLEQFRESLRNEGYASAVKKYVHSSLKSRFKFALKKKVLRLKLKG